MRNRLLLLVLISLLSTTCIAQRGLLVLSQDARIDTLVMKQRQIHVSDSTIDGYRVQIFMELGNDALKHADSVKELFRKDYPEVPVYLVFGQPYYRLRIGDFRTRLEAENMYHQVKKRFRNAFVTGDRIELPYIALCSRIDEYDSLLMDNVDKRIFIEDEILEIDTLLIDSLYINDSIYYDE